MRENHSDVKQTLLNDGFAFRQFQYRVDIEIKNYFGGTLGETKFNGNYHFECYQDHIAETVNKLLMKNANDIDSGLK